MGHAGAPGTIVWKRADKSLNKVRGEQKSSVTRRGPLRLHWLGILGGWLLLSLITAAQRYLFSRTSGAEPGFLVFFFWTPVLWAFWALATPAVFWLGRRVPLRRKTLLWALPAHFGFAVVFGLLHLACWAEIGILIEAARTGRQFRFGNEFLQLFQVLFYVELILYWAILGAGLARHASQQARERELKAQALEAQLREAQLLALKQQLHPHFLFNSLNTVAMLVRNGESGQAVQMIASLGDLLRWSLSETAAPEVTLAAELESARRYLAIEQFRFPDRLRVEVSVPDELINAAVPNLILQPLVENAVRHGIAKASSASLVRISARRRATALELCVEDDGEGFPAEWQPGVGVRNVRARLAQLYGAQAELTVAPQPTHGASVRLLLPYRPLI